MFLLYLRHLASEEPKKLEKAVILGFRETKETRKACALGLQRNQINSKSLCSWASEKPKKLEKPALLCFTETKKIQEGYSLAVLEPLDIRKTEKLEKSVLWGVRETKET